MGNENKFGPWSLSEAENKRLKDYARLSDLISRRADQHDDLYKRDKEESGERTPPHMYVNIGGLVCRSAADLVLPQAPIITSEDDTVQERIDALVRRSKLNRLAWRSVYWTCALGDSFLVIADVLQEKGKADALPVITLRRAVDSVARGVRVEDPPFGCQFLFRSTLNGLDLYAEYLAGMTKWYAYKANNAVSLPEGFESEAQTKELVPLVVHLAALREDTSDEAFGESDFEGTEDLSFEIANRLRQVARVLDRHADPGMNVPDGALDEENKFDVRKRKVFERGVDGGGAEYITWQSQLDAAYSEIDKIIDLISWMTETPGALWGRDSGGEAQSGRALKFKLLAGLGKARRTGGMLKEGLAEAVRLALRREDVLQNRKPGEYEIAVELSDTFIADEMDDAAFVQTMRGAKAMSTKKAVSFGQGLAGDDLEAEVNAINEEAAAEAPLGLNTGRFLGGA